MTEQQPQNPQRESEETIVALARPRAADAPSKQIARSPRRSQSLLIAAAGVLLALVVAVFFFLPQWVEDREMAAAEQAQPVEAAAEVVTEPPLTEAEIAELRSRAESLLADLLEQQSVLEARSVASWGGERFVEYETLSRSGDDAFLADDFGQAADDYADALAVGEGLQLRSDEIMAAALEAGDRAVAAGNAALAIEQYDVVLLVDPDNARAAAGRARAERLPEVLALMADGDRLRQAGDLSAALDAYRQALRIDPHWTDAAVARDEISAAIGSARFERLLSSGYGAIADEDYAAAVDYFTQAIAMRPGSEAARDGLEQAEQGQKLDQIALAEVRALAFERREMWDAAIARYEAALDTDPSLAFALEGLARSRARADLDAKLQNLIDNPNLLLTASVLRDAELLLAEARSLAGTESRLSMQVDQLGALVVAASTPVTVEFRSDAATEVTVYRVGPLGVFDVKAVELRPGTYTAVGSRNGFRDVRRSFTVLPGREIEPITVVCTDSI